MYYTYIAMLHNKYKNCIQMYTNVCCHHKTLPHAIAVAVAVSCG